MEPAPSLPRDELVARCLDDLIDDWHRKGSQLAYDDVTRMAAKRNLSAPQLGSLLEALPQVGVSITGLDQLGDTTDADASDDARDYQPSSDRDALGSYLTEIGRYPLLWAEDEVRLGRLIKAGQDADEALANDTGIKSKSMRDQLGQVSQAGRRAHAELVRSNLRLVVSIARRYRRDGMDLLDLIQEGNLGLLRAADKFDYSLGYKFSTYATWWIRQSIERGIADHSRLIRLPVHVHEKLLKVLRVERRLTDRYDREPTLSELASALEMDTGEVQALLDLGRPTLSLDSLLVHDGDLTMGDLLAADADIDGRTDPVDIMLTAARQRDIEKILDKLLTPREADIVRRRFGIGTHVEQTLDTIGEEFGLTRERIRQIALIAMEKLATSPSSHGLYEYLVARTHRANAIPQQGWPKPEGKRRNKKRAISRR